MSDVDQAGLTALGNLIALMKGIEADGDYQGPLTDCVYYWMRGDLIKIGQTRCLTKRLKALLPGELLAVEPGGRGIEQGRHGQFKDYHEPCDWGTEWFRPGPLLIWHIEAMAKLYPPHLLDELPQFRVPRVQVERPTEREVKHRADAARRLGLWVDMLPRIVEDDVERQRACA